MLNPIETAQKIKAGCGKYTGISDILGYDMPSINCGETLNKEIILCPTCQATLTEKKEEWQKFIEILDGIIMGVIDENDVRDKLDKYNQAVQIANG